MPDDSEDQSCLQSEEPNEKNIEKIVTNLSPSIIESKDCLSNICETSHLRRIDPSIILVNVIQVNDPSTCKLLSKAQKETIIRKGTLENPHCFPRDSSGCCFPTSIFYQELLNGEKVKRDWLVWSLSAQGLFCFACFPFQDLSQQPQTLQLTKSDAGVKGNWQKLYEKIEAHQ